MCNNNSSSAKWVVSNGVVVDTGGGGAGGSYALSLVPKSLVSVKTQYVGNNVAVVELEVNVPGLNRKSFAGEARRSPEDKNNPELALALATARAYQSLANKLTKKSAGLLKQQDDLLQQKAKPVVKKKSKVAK